MIIVTFRHAPGVEFHPLHEDIENLRKAIAWEAQANLIEVQIREETTHLRVFGVSGGLSSVDLEVDVLSYVPTGHFGNITDHALGRIIDATGYRLVQVYFRTYNSQTSFPRLLYSGRSSHLLMEIEGADLDRMIVTVFQQANFVTFLDLLVACQEKPQFWREVKGLTRDRWQRLRDYLAARNIDLPEYDSK